MTATAGAVDVVIVGGGPAGLSAAIALRRRGIDGVVVLDREAEAGGVPRHTDHLGFGLRDLHRMMTGPSYAAKLRTAAERAGVDVRTSTTALDWIAPTSLCVVDRSGISTIDARSVILATGVRERPRSARLVPGDRGAGVFTTGSVQQLVIQHNGRPGRRAVVVGAEHVSFSAAMTLRHAGCDVVAMVTPLPHHQTYTALKLVAATRYRVPVVTDTEIAEIHGRHQVEGVTLTNGTRLDCDTVVFTGGWVPDNELARRGGVVIDPVHRGPAVDAALRTSRAGVFAIGNLIHPAETADICSLDGRHAAAHVVDFLTIGGWPTASVRIAVTDPIAWITPSRIEPGIVTARDRFHLRVNEFAHARSVAVTQADRTLWHGNIVGRKLVPNRSISIAAEWVVDVDPGGGDVHIALSD